MVREKIRDYNYDPNHQHKPIETIRGFKNYRMHIVKKGETAKREIVFGEVTWSENIDNLGMTLRTSIPKNIDDRFMKRYNIAEIGDKIIFSNREEIIFSGMIEEIVENRYSKDIVCYDSGVLLGKNNIIKQFSKANAKSAITKLCNENKIPIGKITNMSSVITEVYKNRSISDIIKDIMQKEEAKTGKRMVMEIRENKLYVEFVNDLKISLIYKPAANVSFFDPRKAIGEINRSDSVTDIKNKVVVVYEKDKKTITAATAQDNKSIKLYGERTHIESITKEEVKQAKTIANNKLRELNNIAIEITVEMLGDDKVRAGRVFELKNETFNTQGDYVVENCEHRYSNNNRYMKLGLKGV